VRAFRRSEVVLSHPEDEPVARAAGALAERFGAAPETAVVLGSGLGGLTAHLQGATEASYAAMGLPLCGAEGHAGLLRCGRLQQARVVVLSGRVHLYEGRSWDEVARPVRVMHRWGVQRVIFTNAVGGITEGFLPGHLVVVSDHLDLQGAHPLAGPAYGGQRFVDLTEAYDADLRRLLLASAARAGAVAHTGVLAAMRGPAYETPAEVRMLRALGADVVGMSTVPGVVAAAALGLPVAALSMVSNRAAGLAGHALTHAEVTQTASVAGDALAATLIDALNRP